MPPIGMQEAEAAARSLTGAEKAPAEDLLSFVRDDTCVRDEAGTDHKRIGMNNAKVMALRST